MTIDNTYLGLTLNTVSSETEASVELSRRNFPSDKLWQPNQCFELLFTSPYADPGVYYSFVDGEDPVCAVSTIVQMPICG